MSHPHFFPYVIHLIQKIPGALLRARRLPSLALTTSSHSGTLHSKTTKRRTRRSRGTTRSRRTPPPILPLPTPPANPPYTPYALPPPCPPTLPPPLPPRPPTLPPPPLRTCRRSSTLYTRDSKTSRRYTGTRSCRESSRVPPETRSTSSSPQITATDPCSSWEMWSRIPYV